MGSHKIDDLAWEKFEFDTPALAVYGLQNYISLASMTVRDVNKYANGMF